MVKTLWHEIGHNRQTGLAARTYVAGSANEILLETTNEFIALRTYPQFLRSIGGGEAEHLSEVRALSGYVGYVDRLERVMTAVGLTLAGCSAPSKKNTEPLKKQLLPYRAKGHERINA